MWMKGAKHEKSKRGNKARAKQKVFASWFMKRREEALASPLLVSTRLK
jgi:hypothetical protein